ncbi:putative sterigmatocystin biosynthesis P450 monooxygenase stcS [Podospora aff. communis PSN243]|uniref:Sterigmatocystin biosynthesis P450 monooxygenase stcS n=1 Tax=Podospora aff. communis PSN243 TaxID=3040156 RepID=A0AAV9GEZ2_9PEZI|nr:putative sterigmatocystin biosynthesis P450 monooxygenase stcS [Podospora aff. communis PSN243]
MANTVVLALAALAVAYIGYWINKFITIRNFYKDKPCPPHDFLLGHAKILGEYNLKFPADTSMQSALTQMKRDFNLPDIFYLDLWPFGPEFVVFSSAEAAAIPSTTKPMEQSPEVKKFFTGNLGSAFIEATSGAEWKELLHMVAPPLTPSATRAYYNTIVEEAKVFYDRMQKLASKGESFDIMHQTGHYTFDVMSVVFFGESERLRSQTEPCQLYNDLQRLTDVMGAVTVMLNPFAKRPLWKERDVLVARMEKDIDKILLSRVTALQQEGDLSAKTKTGSIIDRMLLNNLQSGKPVDARLRKAILDNAKGVLAAGFGTTADTLVWIFLLLATYPDILARVREEHTRIYASSFDETLSLLQSDPNRLKSLDYTTAFIHETLRLFPVGPPLRTPHPDMKSFTHNNQTYPITTHQFEILTHAIHYSESHFPNPKAVLPERHLPLSNPPYSRNAYRPFERGPRACLGSSLAMDEMKVLLVMVARWFDFEHLVPGGEFPRDPRVEYTDLDTKLGDVVFAVQRFTTGPRGPVGMRCRVRG